MGAEGGREDEQMDNKRKILLSIFRQQTSGREWAIRVAKEGGRKAAICKRNTEQHTTGDG